ncbi:hypothetical protein AOR01nite_09390 [Acetobacter orleanensis]|uniref:Uncharacterized protein n=1 Tax=Acetobacter orleanensis TaxID=104099 RepID=A0A4Y3TKK5_9PROT|nr:hypothetical protein Abol_009_124 [Acetobacter orleanensis JCM 7639]GEB82462.1 hypothetical protein AOR01nite_09390 [Acetobacter orleanensis]
MAGSVRRRCVDAEFRKGGAGNGAAFFVSAGRSLTLLPDAIFLRFVIGACQAWGCSPGMCMTA